MVTNRKFKQIGAAGAMLLGLASAGRESLAGSFVPYPETLIAQGAQGTQIYQPALSGATGPVTFSLPVTAGRTITLDVAPELGLQPTVQITDPLGNVIASGTAAAAGQEALLETVPASITGTYKVSIDGVAATSGKFTADALINTALEYEAHGGPSNNNVATAQDLSSSAVVLGPSADRMAVLGRAAGSADFYSFALQAGESVTLATRFAGAVDLVDGGGNVLAAGSPEALNESLFIHNFVAPNAGTYYAEVTGGTEGNYSLIVTRGTDFSYIPVAESGSTCSLLLISLGVSGLLGKKNAKSQLG